MITLGYTVNIRYRNPCNAKFLAIKNQYRCVQLFVIPNTSQRVCYIRNVITHKRSHKSLIFVFVIVIQRKTSNKGSV